MPVNVIGEALGELCRVAFPIRHESYAGNPESHVAVCTLSDIGLLGDLASSRDVLQRVHIVGRLLSENKGIDAILRYLHANPCVNILIVCGVDGGGHRAGHSLLRLHDRGTVHATNRISGSHSPDPYLTATPEQISHFCQNVSVVDMTGVRDRAELIRRIIASTRPSACPG